MKIVRRPDLPPDPGDQVWITDQRYRILGTNFRVMTQNFDLANGIDALFTDFATIGASARLAHTIQITERAGEPHRLYQGCHLKGSKEGVEELLQLLVAVVNRAAIDATEWFAVHAAVVADGDNLVAFPAVSGGGKSTLAVAAIQAGFSYASDEALVLDDDGAVIPYPKPIALSVWSCEALGVGRGEHERLFPVRDLGGRSLLDPTRLTDLAIATHREGSTAITTLPSSYAVAELIAKSFNHYKDPDRAFRLATLVAREVAVWKLDYDDPRDAIEELRSAIT